MDVVLNFIFSNFALVFINVGFLFVLIMNQKLNRKRTLLATIICFVSLILEIILTGEDTSISVGNPYAASIALYLGYVIRPVVVFLYMWLITDLGKKKWIFIGIMALNALVYIPGLFVDYPEVTKFVYYLIPNPNGTGLLYQRGYFPFSAHIISAGFIVYIIYLNTKRFNTTKRKADAISFYVCIVFLIAAVVLESLSLARHILNITIAVSCVFYYLYLYVEEMNRDPLTGLSDRRLFYNDIEKYGKAINGVVNIDMNGLKQLNDNLGHDEGDKAIVAVAKATEKACHKNNRFAYRMGGDEFLVLVHNTSKEELDEIKRLIHEELAKSKYSASIGYALRENETDTIDILIRQSEKDMYQEKKDYYEKSGNNRRKKIPE